MRKGANSPLFIMFDAAIFFVRKVNAETVELYLQHSTKILASWSALQVFNEGFSKAVETLETMTGIYASLNSIFGDEEIGSDVESFISLIPRSLARGVGIVKWNFIDTPGDIWWTCDNDYIFAEGQGNFIVKPQLRATYGLSLLGLISLGFSLYYKVSGSNYVSILPPDITETHYPSFTFPRSGDEVFLPLDSGLDGTQAEYELFYRQRMGSYPYTLTSSKTRISSLGCYPEPEYEVSGHLHDVRISYCPLCEGGTGQTIQKLQNIISGTYDYFIVDNGDDNRVWGLPMPLQGLVIDIETNSGIVSRKDTVDVIYAEKPIYVVPPLFERQTGTGAHGGAIPLLIKKALQHKGILTEGGLTGFSLAAGGNLLSIVDKLLTVNDKEIRIKE